MLTTAPLRAADSAVEFELKDGDRVVTLGGTFEELAEHEVNGRQIRNLVRLVRILKPQRLVTLDEMCEALSFGCR